MLLKSKFIIKKIINKNNLHVMIKYYAFIYALNDEHCVFVLTSFY